MQNYTPHDLEVLPPQHKDREGSFPDLPKLTVRGTYVLDGKRESICSKIGKRQKNLLPGVFLVHCPHAVCYGFEIMDNHESPNTPFTAIRTRFTAAPEVIVYDNACNLHKYAINRDPGFFAKTKFLVDGFHWGNHTGCTTGYNSGCYIQYKDLNTQVAEQRNATLKKLKSSLSYMHEENFFEHLRVFLSFHNAIAITNMRDPCNADESLIRRLKSL
ncbi:uncharacterized protein [Watersipora subatra]